MMQGSSTDRIDYRTMRAGEEDAVCDLVRDVFAACIGPDFAEEGVREFLRFANPAAMRARVRAGGFVLLALESDRPVGMLEFVPPDRIALLFVLPRGRGIGAALMTRAIAQIRQADPDVPRLTVHASRRAAPIYRKLGFRATGAETTEHGIVYVPMARDL